MVNKTHKQNTILKILKISAIVCFVAAAVLMVLMILFQIDGIREKYDEYLAFLEEFEMRVASLKNRWLILVVIFLLFLLRSLSMIYPYSMVYMITAMVFEPHLSFFINLTGMAFTFAFRYYTGLEMGEGTVNKVLKKNPAIISSMEAGGKGNPVVLLALRLIPGVPINTVSHLYGSLHYPFVRYMLISTAAYVPKMISFSFIGTNVYNPFSAKFFAPLIILLLFTGISLLVLRTVFIVKYKFSEKNKPKGN